jgi:hypothetical protein
MTLETRLEVEICRMERILRSYGGVLTRERLFRECHADRWPVLDSFGAAVTQATATGRMRALGNELIAVPIER